MDLESSNKSTKQPFNIMELFENEDIVKICAPMVRYSKLQFRNLVRSYNCDLCFTPMILADSFCKSLKARNNEFTTNLSTTVGLRHLFSDFVTHVYVLDDVPLITQFAANSVHDFVGAAHMVSPFCDGVDLNCGCPQRWAKQQGLGCVMLERPETIYDLIRQCRNAINKPFTVSVKMRLKKELKKSVEICRQLEKCGVSFLTIHGRTPDQLTGDVNVDALRQIVDSVEVPVVSNGGVKSLQECVELRESTNSKGVMVANGLLTNPTLFTGTPTTTTECVQRWVNICYNTTLESRVPCSIPEMGEKPSNLTFQCFHHHLVFMLEKILTRQEKRIFNNLQTFSDVLSFIKQKFDIVPQVFDINEFDRTCVLDLNFSNREEVYLGLRPDEPDQGRDLLYDCSGQGKYFKGKIQEDENCDWSDIFSENG